MERIVEPLPSLSDKSDIKKSCKVPGRINLLGEHLDYNGLPVMPMCIDKYINMQFVSNENNTVYLYNSDPVYSEVLFKHTPKLSPGEPGSWENYIKAALQAINVDRNITNPPGMVLHVNGDLPNAMGLSSSTALVIASALAYLDILGMPPRSPEERIQLAELLADAEHYVGTQGGGMDQAIILNGIEDHAHRIHFHPLRIEAAPAFSDTVFYVADSLERADKSYGKRDIYNAGPILCRLCCKLLERHFEREYSMPVTINRIAELWSGLLCLTHSEVRECFSSVFPEQGMSLKDCAEKLGIEAGELCDGLLQGLQINDNELLPLFKRMRHQLTEYQRVEKGFDALNSGDAITFGRLMQESHASCRDDYEISTEALDTLTTMALEAGALGARLTGAGFGGAAICLVPLEHVKSFRVQLIDCYYKPRLGNQDVHPLYLVNPVGAARYEDIP